MSPEELDTLMNDSDIDNEGGSVGEDRDRPT
jgi:hypothetical protein